MDLRRRVGSTNAQAVGDTVDPDVTIESATPVARACDSDSAPSKKINNESG